MDVDSLISNTAAAADTLFGAANNQQAQLESLANQALTSGIDKYTNEDYEGAAQEFRRAFGLSPYSDYVVDTVKYLAQSYVKLERTDKAIAAYKEAIQIHSDSDELQTALGNLYFGEGRYGEALEAYETAVRIYDDEVNRYSLGQAYLSTGQLDNAQTQFEKVIDKAPDNYSGYFGLGQVLAAKKNYTAAIEQFERAFDKNDEFYDAYAEIGFTYADAGETDKAEDILSELEYMDESLAQTLESYINKKTKPKMLFAWADSSFQYYLPPKTQVSAIGEYLSNANTSETFMLQIQFDKSMDRDSVENITNWSISRSSGNGPGTAYNNGLPIPSTEATLSMLPMDVYYDDTTFTATLRFNINQNATANATIDPSHIVFSFKGIDADGNTMDTQADQYMGASGAF